MKFDLLRLQRDIESGVAKITARKIDGAVPLRLESSQYRAGGWMEALDRASAGGFPRHLLEAALAAEDVFAIRFKQTLGFREFLARFFSVLEECDRCGSQFVVHDFALPAER